MPAKRYFRRQFSSSLCQRSSSSESRPRFVSQACLAVSVPIIYTASRSFSSSDDRRTRLDGGNPRKTEGQKKETESQSFFAAVESSDFWKTIKSVAPAGDDEQASDHPFSQSQKKQEETAAGYQSMASDFLSMISGFKRRDETIQEIVAKVRENREEGDIEDTVSLTQLFTMLNDYGEQVQRVAERFVGGLDLTQFNPTSLMYFLEYEDERKNPSWKRRAHRFCPGIDMSYVESLYKGLMMAELCYADSIDQIREGLESDVNDPYELVYVDLQSAPGEPAHFIAVKRDQKVWSSKLQVVMGVRGTKTVADALTDLLCDTTDYKGGAAHAFIVKGGKFLVEKHTKLLEDLCRRAGKSSIQLDIVGHSLGAGAGSIAGIEFNEKQNFDVQVLGFGCPALLSKDLAEKYSFITTIINDSDIVPRLSGISMANLLLEIMEFDWFKYSLRDVTHALDEIHKRQPTFFPRELCQKILSSVEPVLKSFCESTIKQKKSIKIKPDLYPPGRCVHFYRDGYGVSAAIVPNDFFESIDFNRRMIDGKKS